MQFAARPSAHHAIAENLRKALSQYALATPHGELDERPRLTLVNSGLRYSVFNSAILSEPGVSTSLELTAVLVSASGYFLKRGLPWTFWMPVPHVHPRLLRQAPAICARYGLRLVAEHDGLQADEILPPRRLLPELDVVRVNSGESRQAFADISRHVFGLPKWVASEIYGGSLIWDGDMVGWVGYAGGKPICTASTVSDSGAVGIYSVATLPEYRRLGYGEAITRAALLRARQQSGIKATILHATPLGLPIYIKMGYLPVTQISVFASNSR